MRSSHRGMVKKGFGFPLISSNFAVPALAISLAALVTNARQATIVSRNVLPVAARRLAPKDSHVTPMGNVIAAQTLRESNAIGANPTSSIGPSARNAIATRLGLCPSFRDATRVCGREVKVSMYPYSHQCHPVNCARAVPMCKAAPVPSANQIIGTCKPTTRRVASTVAAT